MTSQTADAGRGQNQAPLCAECGTPPTPGQSFCDGCGAVLGWTPGPAGIPGPAGLPGPGFAPGTADDDTTPVPSAAALDPAALDPAALDPAADPGLRTTGVRPAAGFADPDAAERARALLIPVADPEPGAAAPSLAPVLPGRPISARPQVRGLQEQDDEDGARCPWCGTGNRPDRHFCRRCAMTMAGRPADPARLPWWRRLPGLRGRRVPWAGERPRLRRGLGRVLALVVGVVALALLVTAAFQVGAVAQSVRDHFTKRAPISPDSYRASHSYVGHGPALAFDKFNNTWWGPGLTQSDAGEWVEADFSQPADLLDVVITSGESTLPSDLAKSALPHTVEAVITTADGRTRSRLLTLDQAGGGQTRALRVSDVTAVRFILRSAYGASAEKQVAVAEIEFFGRSSGGSS
ncbi:NADase-type glycan-binding domain-containing protein [Streptacidiphilus sp. PAMC 29251]